MFTQVYFYAADSYRACDSAIRMRADGQLMSLPAVILVAGRDPQRYFMTATAAMCAYTDMLQHDRYDVHLLCLDKSNRTETTAYGTFTP